MTVYRIFTIGSDRRPQGGATVKEFNLSRAGVAIQAVLVGERGRGRELGVLPVAGAQPGETIYAARVAQTRSGKPKLIAASPEEATDEAAIVVLLTPIGFRGSNKHTGDILSVRLMEKDPLMSSGWVKAIMEVLHQAGLDYQPGQPLTWADRARVRGALEAAGKMGLAERFATWEFAPFPGRWLVRGWTAQGDAGRMGAGRQGVAIIPRGQVFRTWLGGRVYGNPRSMYYVFTGLDILAATLAEREAITDVDETHPLALPELS